MTVAVLPGEPRATTRTLFRVPSRMALERSRSTVCPELRSIKWQVWAPTFGDCAEPVPVQVPGVLASAAGEKTSCSRAHSAQAAVRNLTERAWLTALPHQRVV
jgi:hypothetical protein